MTKEHLYVCRMPNGGVSALLHQNRRFRRLSEMRALVPLGSFEVAMDADASGSKSFTYFADPAEFFADTYAVVHRNFYEIIQENQACCLYFDLEHYTGLATDDDQLTLAMQIIEQEGTKRWQIEPKCWASVVVLTASRVVQTGYKHSYHLVYPAIGFQRNHGALRAFARELAVMPALQAKGKRGEQLSLLDSKVYNRNQAFRLVESWKYASLDAAHPDMALRFYDKRPHTLEHLLQTVVTRTAQVTHWIQEEDMVRPPESQTSQRSALHDAGLDALKVLDNQCLCLEVVCPCSGFPIPMNTRLRLERGHNGWKLTCSHKDCIAAKQTGCQLGPGVSLRRAWAEATTPEEGRHDVNHRITQLGAITTAEMETMTITLATAKGWCVTREAGVTLGRNPDQVFFLSPSMTEEFIRQLDSAEISSWRFLDGFAQVRFFVYEERDCQWVTGLYDKPNKTMYLETAMGEVTQRLCTTMWKWITLTCTDDVSAWKCLLSASEVCSSPHNSAVFTWAALWSDSRDERPTGEEAYAWRWRAYCYAGHAQTRPVHLEKFNYGTIKWQTRPLGTDQSVKRRKLDKVQSKIPWPRAPVEQAPDIPPSFEGEIPVLPCADYYLAPAEGGEWCPHRFPPDRTSRIFSQNVGPTGLRNVLSTIQRSIRVHQPSVVFLQDCRVREDDHQLIRRLRESFPQYVLYIRSGDRQEKRRLRVKQQKQPRHYCFSVVTLVHIGCGKTSEFRPEESAATMHRGRILTVCVEPVNQPPFLVTNLYNYTSGEPHRQRELFQLLTARLETDKSKVHVIAGDFNSSLFGTYRRGYTSNPRCVEADQLFTDFVLNPAVHCKWWAGRIDEGLWTRRNPSKVQYGRLDEILILGTQPLHQDILERELTGQCYRMHSSDHNESRLDHYTLVADISTSVMPKCQHRAPRSRLETVDVLAWEANQDAWRENTLRNFVPPDSVDPYAVLDAWIQAAASQAPTKVRAIGGVSHPRPPHDSALSRKLNKEIRLLERELDLTAPTDTPLRITNSMRKISRWEGADDIKRITLPTAPPPDASWTKWRTELQEGIQERRKHLKMLLRQERKDVLQDVRSRCRARMERPREKEIQRLLGKRVAKAPSDRRSSKLKQKRHPDKICARLSDEKWKAWVEATAGPELWSHVERLRAQVRDEPLSDYMQCWHSKNMTVEVLVGSATELQLRVSPMDKIAMFMERKPTLSPEEYIRVSSSEVQKLKHDTDTVCHEECFFATNAMSAQTYCPACCHPSHKPTPLSKVNREGHRELRYVCTCGEVRKSFPTRPLQKCPVPDDLLRSFGFQTTEPILTAFLEREDFDAWLRRRPTGKSPGEDTISYEMWQAAPEPMKDALYRAVLHAVTSGHIPSTWEGSLVKLLVKREGEEHILESLRPICLMATAAKITTGIWAHRMSAAAEKDGVYEGSQEGFRPDRSAKRQAARFLSCVQASKGRHAKLIVAFLDFENYFNTISLPALFMILRKLEMPEADVRALECYYASSYMQVSHPDGSKSARIPLGRGLRQGCPLSPILGGLVVNAMLRWIEHQGGGIRHPSGVETNALAFADDATLLVEGTTQMAKLLQCVHEFCEWAGVQINLGKSEVTGYDFGTGRPINTCSLNIGGQSPKHIHPSTPFKYLGIRLNVLGNMDAEREYVISKTRALRTMLRGHQYHPRQIHNVVQTAIVPIFRYSAALAQWSDGDLGRLWREWCRAYKHAWKMKPSTSASFFCAGGLDVGTPAEILVKEVAGLLEQCFAIHSDLRDMLQMEMCQLVRDMGCSTMAELQHHLGNAFPPHPMDTLCYSFLSSMNPSALVKWNSITVEDREDTCRAPSRQICEELKAPGLLSLLQDMENLLTLDEMRIATHFLYTVAALGFHRLSSVLQGSVLEMPDAAEPTREVRAALQSLVNHKQVTLAWTSTGKRGTVFRDILANVRPGDRGAALVGSTIRLKHGKTHSYGSIGSYCESSCTYAVRMQDRTSRKLSHDQVKDSWVAPTFRTTWTRRDQIRVGACVKKILGSKTVRQSRQLRTPHVTVLSSETWATESLYYLCTIEYRLPESVRAMLARPWSVDVDRRIAQSLSDEQIVFWASKDMWEWQSSSVSNQAGWIVQACGVTERARGVLLVVRSLHQDEHHREGEIWMTSSEGPSLRKLHEMHMKRTQSPMIYLTAAELGDVERGGYEPCPALRAYCPEKLTNVLPELPAISCQPIIRRPHAFTPQLPQVHFDIDMTALKPVDLSFEWKGHTTRVTLHHGQAFLGSAPHCHAGQSLKSVGARRARKRGKYHIDASRMAVLREWHRDEDMISIWKAEWDKLAAWEESGGRTLNWTITTRLLQQYDIQNAVCVHSLAIDPSFDCYMVLGEQPRPGKTYLPLYEMTSEQAARALTQYAGHDWVAVTRVNSKSPVIKKLRQAGCLIHRFDKGARIMLKKGWWKTGERQVIKSDCEYEIWHSKSMQTRAGLDGVETESQWLPSEELNQQSGSLSIYLRALPGAKYHTQGLVMATDGSLRKRTSPKEFSMGAGVASTGRHPMRISLRVGGQFSSTRAELVAIVVALQRAERHATVAILVDSSAALRRLAWCRSKDFRPSPRRIKDLDVMRDIVTALLKRQELGFATTFVKVHGHSGDPLHAVADHLAVQGAAHEEEEAEYVAGRPDCILYSWMKNEEECAHPWGPQIKKRIKSVMGPRARDVYTSAGVVDDFLRRENAGRALLGSALRSAWDWAVRGWMLGISPHSYPVQANICRWRKHGSAQCECGRASETFAHLQLVCTLEHRRALRQQAHNRIASLVERYANKIAPRDRVAVWDKQVSTFLNALAQARPNGAVLSAVTIGNLAKWKAVVRRDQPGTRLAGTKRTIADINAYFDSGILKQRPDGLIFDLQQRVIYLVEIARTGDSEASLRNRYIQKTLKYGPIVEALGAAFCPCKVEQVTLVIGVLGSIIESTWRRSLTTLGIPDARQDKLIRKCMTATIEGTHSVLLSNSTGKM